MSKEILEKNIYYYKNIIPYPNSLIKEIEFMDALQSEGTQISKWKKWIASNSETDYGYYKEGLLNNKLADKAVNDHNSKVSSLIEQVANYAADEFSKETGLEKGFLPEYFSIRKYNTGVYMGSHTDNHNEGPLKPTLSMVIYLNNDYEGGNIEFPNHSVSIKPEAGSLIIFPSVEPYLHDPKPTTSGTKYMIPLFFFTN